MPAVESFGVALFIMVFVFFVLLCLYLCINLFSRTIRMIEDTMERRKLNQEN